MKPFTPLESSGNNPKQPRFGAWGRSPHAARGEKRMKPYSPFKNFRVLGEGTEPPQFFVYHRFYKILEIEIKSEAKKVFQIFFLLLLPKSISEKERPKNRHKSTIVLRGLRGKEAPNKLQEFSEATSFVQYIYIYVHKYIYSLYNITLCGISSTIRR